MLRKLLANYEGVEEAFHAAGIAPTARAEELSIEQWITLANQHRGWKAEDTGG